jgi:hypothetical protein
MKRNLIFMGLLLAGCLSAGASWARVQITALAVSPKILLEAFRSSQNNLSTITWIDSNVLMLAVTSDTATAGQNFTFNIEITDGGNQVASIGPFRVLPRTLAAGGNVYNANDVKADGLQIIFNKNYSPSVDINNLGNPMPMGNYRVMLRPAEPTPGDPYTMNLSLFTPSSALNQPPVTIYPKDVEVNTMLPTFSWTPASHAAWYQVSVGPEINPDVNTYWKSGNLNVTQVLYASSARNLENGKRYYWQVQAFDAFGKPVGGVDGKSQPTAFTVISSNRVNTIVSPLEAEAALKPAVPNAEIFSKLAAYQPVAIETNCSDVADLLRQLKDGSAKIISARVE